MVEIFIYDSEPMNDERYYIWLHIAYLLLPI